MLYVILGFFIGLFLLYFIKPSNYTRDLINDIKSDLNIDISKNKDEQLS